MRQLDRATNKRRYMPGDAIKLAVVLDHKANLSEVRVVFAHAYDENATVIGRGTPHPISERGADGSMRSRLDAEITLPRGVTPGVYNLIRVSYETAGGRLGHLAEEQGLSNTFPRTFEVLREPEDAPKIAHLAFANDRSDR
jgi:hypothetical protein